MQSRYSTLYEYIGAFERQNIWEIEDYLKSLNDSQFESFVIGLAEAHPFDSANAESVFSFTADSTLGAGPFPCGDFLCRELNLYNLARFATLYADRVFIRSPIMEAIESHDGYIDTCELAFGIYVTAKIEQLVQCGIIGLIDCNIPLCDNCLKRVVQNESEVVSMMNSLKTQLVNDFIDQTKCTFEVAPDGIPFVEISGMGQYGTHEIVDVDFVNYLPSILQPLADSTRSNGVVLNSKQICESGIPALLEPMIYDTLHVLTDPRVSNSTYLTTRPAQIDLMRSIERRTTNDPGPETEQIALNLDLPYIFDLPISNLLAFRQANYESFLVYRDSIASNLQGSFPCNKQELDMLRRECIDPELHKINRMLQNSCNELKSAAGIGGAISIATIAIGSHIGLGIGDIASLAGLFGAGPIAQKAFDHINKNSAKSNPLYFLWKLDRQSKRRRLPN